MKLSISNIAWEAEEDERVYRHLLKRGFQGLEIAPTRWFAQEPYRHGAEARARARALKETWGLAISSMQSIWYGRTERLFSTDEERNVLLDYTERAMDFAAGLGCGNLVFGCPRNRVRPENAPQEPVEDFFRTCGVYALSVGTCLALEANPPIYNTNYINTTAQAVACVQSVDCPGFRVNVDVGTMLYNGEPISLLEENLPLVNHIHISEPGLATPDHEPFWRTLFAALQHRSFDGYVSIEMDKRCGLAAVLHTVDRIARLRDETGEGYKL